MTLAIGHSSLSNPKNRVPAAFLTLGVFATIMLLGVPALRSSGASSGKADLPAAPAAYVPSSADWFEQRVAGSFGGPAPYVPSSADWFEQRVAGSFGGPAPYVPSSADWFEQRVAD